MASNLLVHRRDAEQRRRFVSSAGGGGGGSGGGNGVVVVVRVVVVAVVAVVLLVVVMMAVVAGKIKSGGDLHISRVSGKDLWLSRLYHREYVRWNPDVCTAAPPNSQPRKKKTSPVQPITNRCAFFERTRYFLDV